jgi:hypothetical protein
MVSGGTIASFKAMTEVDPYRIKRSMGEFALVTAGGWFHLSCAQMLEEAV